MNKWDIGQVVSKQDYTEVAIKCNELGDRHIELVNGQYVVVANVIHEPTIQEQIEELERQITPRNLRSAIQGDQFALAKIDEIEVQIAELRRQLLDNEGN